MIALAWCTAQHCYEPHAVADEAVQFKDIAAVIGR
jgi:hypothetical protein